MVHFTRTGFINSLVALISMFTAVIATAAEFRYTAYNFIWDEGENCFDLAQQTRQRFEVAFQKKTVGAGCEYSESTKRTNLVIRYESDKALPVVSLHSLRLYYEPDGFYDNKTQCELDREWQTQMFESRTSLAPFMAYCTFSRHLSPMPWGLHMDAIGTPTKMPHKDSFRTGKPYYPSTSDLNQMLIRGLSSGGIDVASVAWRPNIGHSKATVLGYAGVEFNLDSLHFAEIAGLAACTRVVQDMERQLGNAASEWGYLTSYCASGYTNPRDFDLTVVTLGEKPATKYSVETFATRDDCQRALPGIVLEMSQLTTVRFAVCGEQPNSSEIRVAAIVNSSDQNASGNHFAR